GIIDKDFKRLHLAFLIEEKLRLGKRHHDARRVIFRHADLEDGDNRISLHARIDAKGGHIAIGRDHAQRIADGKAEIFRHARADGDAARLIEALERALANIAGNELKLFEIFLTQAPDQRAVASADIALHKRLPFHHGNGELD